MRPEFSVIICTHNREPYLKDTVTAVLQQELPQDWYEVIIVDNAPDESARQDGTPVDSGEHVTCFVEPRLGLSYARNTGWQHASGEYIVFLDDDAVPELDWLQNIWECIEHNSAISVLGGAVLPLWSEPVPDWLQKELYPALSVCTYKGPSECFPLDFPHQYPVGANITYSRQLLTDLGGFNHSFGRRGDLLLSGEETELNYRAIAAGEQIWYCPAAVVRHRILPQRMRREFFRRRYYWSGRTWALLDLSIHGKATLKHNLLRRLVIGLSLDLPRYFYFGIKRRNPLLTEVHYRELIGYLIQSIDMLRDVRHPAATR